MLENFSENCDVSGSPNDLELLDLPETCRWFHAKWAKTAKPVCAGCPAFLLGANGALTGQAGMHTPFLI